jgi:hypothetical protein
MGEKERNSKTQIQSQAKLELLSCGENVYNETKKECPRSSSRYGKAEFSIKIWSSQYLR